MHYLLQKVAMTVLVTIICCTVVTTMPERVKPSVAAELNQLVLLFFRHPVIDLLVFLGSLGVM